MSDTTVVNVFLHWPVFFLWVDKTLAWEISLLLCHLQVALGNTRDLLAADYQADKLPAGKHSVKGLGQVAPDPSATITL